MIEKLLQLITTTAIMLSKLHVIVHCRKNEHRMVIDSFSLQGLLLCNIKIRSYIEMCNDSFDLPTKAESPVRVGSAAGGEGVGGCENISKQTKKRVKEKRHGKAKTWERQKEKKGKR